ncbi:MAG: cold shock domain-containing protein [Alphaproteobacteria bacterium]|nr:cold shock domain-containing protein [Alphaproteobacteria bacterium]
MDGEITWFDKRRGYGFIVPDDGGDDIIFTAPNAAFHGRPGDRVSFRITDGPLGPEAVDVER